MANHLPLSLPPCPSLAPPRHMIFNPSSLFSTHSASCCWQGLLELGAHLESGHSLFFLSVYNVCLLLCVVCSGMRKQHGMRCVRSLHPRWSWWVQPQDATAVWPPNTWTVRKHLRGLSGFHTYLIRYFFLSTRSRRKEVGLKAGTLGSNGILSVS